VPHGGWRRTRCRYSHWGLVWRSATLRSVNTNTDPYSINVTLGQKILYSIGALVLLVVAIGVFLPATVVVERESTIDAPRASVFALLNDYRQVNEWSPWTDTDPNALYTLSGPPRGEGATMTWDGRIIGLGGQVITESTPYERIVNLLDLGGGSVATSTFNLRRIDNQTEVVWQFKRDFGLNLAGRYFGQILDGIIGPDYEKGLQNLKTMAEQLPAADFSDIEIEHRNVEAMDIAWLAAISKPEASAMSEALGAAYFELLNFIDKHDLTEAGAPMVIGGTFNGSALQFNAAIPIRGMDGDGDAPQANSGVQQGVQLGKSYEGRVIRVKHIGSYRELDRTHDKIAAYLAAFGISRNGDAWESYVSDPTRVDEDELLTYVYYPIEQEF
jgi:effector-binding domain-containing protein